MNVNAQLNYFLVNLHTSSCAAITTSIFKPFHPPPKFLCACLQSGPAPALPTWCALPLNSFAFLEIAYICSFHCLSIYQLMGSGMVSRFGYCE